MARHDAAMTMLETPVKGSKYARVASTGTLNVGAGIVSAVASLTLAAVANTDTVYVKGGATEYAQLTSARLTAAARVSANVDGSAASPAVSVGSGLTTTGAFGSSALFGVAVAGGEIGRFVASGAGGLGIGTEGALSDSVDKLETSRDGGNAGIRASTFGGGAEPYVATLAARGTRASPTALQSGDVVGRFDAMGQRSTTVGQFNAVARLQAVATDNFSGTTVGARWSFQTTTTATASLALVERLSLSSTEAVFNDAGADTDFRVEGVGQANGLFYDAGNNRLGVLNGAPSYPLDVTGVARVNTNGTAAAPALIVGSSETNTGLFNTGADILGFATAGVERMRISATQVLVTGNAGSQLDVYDSASNSRVVTKVVSGSNPTIYNYYDGGANAGNAGALNIQGGPTGGGTIALSGWGRGDSSAGDVGIYTGLAANSYTQRMYFDASTGYVTVGSSAPTHSFSVTSGSSGIALDAPTQQIGTTFGALGGFGINAESPGATTGSWIFLGASLRGDSLRSAVIFESGGNEYARVDGDYTGHTLGNFGIGSFRSVGVPTKLTVQADGSASTVVISMGATSDGNTGFFHPAADQIGYAAGGSEIARMTTTGLGILNTSPSYPLDVTGVARVNANGTAAAPALIVGSSETNTGLFNAGSDALCVAVAGSEFARMTSTGLGIFKTATVALDVAGSVLFKRSGSDSTSAFEVQTTGGTTVIGVDTTNQRFGVGTSTPAVTADIRGALCAQVPVEAKTTTTTVTSAKSRTSYTNEGATALVLFDLPTAAAGLRYRFLVQDADGIGVGAAAGDTIRIDGSVSSTGGTASCSTIGAVLELEAINATEWIATIARGTWALT